MSTGTETVQQEDPPRQARSIYLPVEDHAEIAELANRERRSYSRQCEVLIREALDARRGKGRAA